MLPREDFFLNVEVKSINLVHFEKIKRSMDTSLNTHMKQNCKQILFIFMDILQSLPFQTVLLFINNNLFLLSYSILYQFTLFSYFFYNYNDHIKMCLYLTGCRKSFLYSLA